MRGPGRQAGYSSVLRLALLALLGTLSGLSLARAQTLAAPSEEQTVPSVRVLSPADGTSVRQREIGVQLAVHLPTGAQLQRLYATINREVVAQTRDIVVDTAEAPVSPLRLDEASYRLQVPVPAQDTTVIFHAETATARSEPAYLHLRWAGEQSQGFVVQPNLYVLAIGVGKYELRHLDLLYPSKDAQELAAVFARQQGQLYRRVVTRVLVDQSATRNAITDGLEWLQRQTTARDVAVLFLAGHGINDASTGRYYFLPYDANPDAVKRTMVSQEEVQTTLRSIAGKVVLFLDTCHSGNVMDSWKTRGPSDLSGFVRELAGAENGAVVFAASTGQQASKESLQWGNGAFTKAAVEGLGGRAAYLSGRPITINMLELYISERVKELTQGTQTPTTAKPTTISDFPIAVKTQQSPVPLAPTPLPTEPPRRVPVYKRLDLWLPIGSLVVIGAIVGLGVGLTQSNAASSNPKADFSDVKTWIPLRPRQLD